MTDPLIDRDALLDTPITARVECRVCGAVFYGGDFDQAYIVALGHLRQVHWGKPDD